MSQASDCQASPAARAKHAAGFVCTADNDAFGAAWVHVAGELDLATTPRLQRVLRRAQTRAGVVVIDLRELAFIDCFGLQVIVDAAIRARLDHCRLLVARGPAIVDKVFTLTGAFQQIEIIDLQPGDRPADTRALPESRSDPLNSGTQRPYRPVQAPG